MTETRMWTCLSQLSRMRIAVPLASLVLVVFPFISAKAQDHSMSVHETHMGMTAAADGALDPARQAKLLADKRESEFNHHLAGFFVVLAGLFILAETNLPERGPWVRFAWPVCFVLSGIRSEEHTSELQSPCNLVCRLLLEKKNNMTSK